MWTVMLTKRHKNTKFHQAIFYIQCNSFEVVISTKGIQLAFDYHLKPTHIKIIL